MITCKLEDNCNQCNNKCENCCKKDTCDYVWISNLWIAENKKFKKDSLLGPMMPIDLKASLAARHVISVTGKYDFCCFNVPKTKDVVVIGDIYVDDAARGQGISKQIINYLMETYDRDIFAKCVRGTSAEQFWSHIGEQIDGNEGRDPNDLYQHRPGKRDLGWYKVVNVNKKNIKEDLW